MIKNIIIVITALSVAFIMGCDVYKISDLEKRVAQYEQDLSQKNQELSKRDEQINQLKAELEKTIAQLENANKEILSLAETNREHTNKLQELETTMKNLLDEMGKKSLIIPLLLIGKTAVIYTKPYGDVQIYIGTITKILHGEKILIEIPQTPRQTVEIQFNDIIGYRMLRE
ncbi:MAG: hypothetical protein QME51_01380 [Planctomycetota bacterium]|nr:hypothetical protein [Planctomycetota bacterium]MDI6787007.1 hypothetical protein [Planctomycetota bacterium]